MNNILRNVLMRRSVYSFDGRPVIDEDLLEILGEGKALSNAEDNKAWHFTVLQNRRLVEEVRDVINDSLSKESKSRLMEIPPVLMIISSCADADYAIDAANMVFAGMMLVAEKRGIAACWLSAATEIFKTKKGKAIFQKIGIPNTFLPLCIGAFGYKQLPQGAGSLLTNDNVINIIK